jgi:hypothetical protein
VNVHHAKSRLIPESLRTLRSEDKGQAEACPDRTRAIPCTVRAGHGRDGATPSSARPTHYQRAPEMLPNRHQQPMIVTTSNS